MDNLKEIIAAQEEAIIGYRRDLHRIPELAFTEQKTAAYLAQSLSNLDLEVQTGIAETGLMALLSTGRPGPTLLVRADMDALPLTEATGLDFASRHTGVMHACGHDAHMAMVLGAAVVLTQIRDRLMGNVKFVFQPAEEGPGGAEPMIAAGVMQNPDVDYCIGCHLWPALEEATIGVGDGTIMAAMDQWDLKIIGKGGHGAMPHQCVDPIEIACQVVNALQRITSRHLDPLVPAVVSVGSFHAGTNFNIIPDEAVLSGTTRTFDREIWRAWPQRLETIIAGVCQSMGAKYEFTFSPGYPPTVNDAAMSDVVRTFAAEVVGQKNVIVPQPSMGGEDMAYFLEKSPGCFFWLGTGGGGRISVHSPFFTFNDRILAIGVETYARVALHLLAR